MLQTSTFRHRSHPLQGSLMHCVLSSRLKIWLCAFEDWSAAAMLLHLLVPCTLLHGTYLTHAVMFYFDATYAFIVSVFCLLRVWVLQNVITSWFSAKPLHRQSYNTWAVRLPFYGHYFVLLSLSSFLAVHMLGRNHPWTMDMLIPRVRKRGTICEHCRVVPGSAVLYWRSLLSPPQSTDKTVSASIMQRHNVLAPHHN